MDYLRLDPAIDSDPALEEAGWWATRVYELLLKVSAMRDLRGRIPPECQRPSWLAKRWGLPADMMDPESLFPGCIESLVQVGRLRRESDGTLVIAGWEKWYPTPKTGAERTAAWRERQRGVSDECDEAASQPVTVTDTYSTPPHSTPPNTTRRSTTTTTEPSQAAAAEDQGLDPGKLWAAMQEARAARGLEAEGASPKTWTRWVRQAAEAVGENAQERILAAYATFLTDARAKRLRSDAAQVFCSESIWRSRLPAKAPPAPPKPVPKPCARCGAPTPVFLFTTPCCSDCKGAFFKLRRAEEPDPDPAVQEAALRAAAAAWLSPDARGAA